MLDVLWPQRSSRSTGNIRQGKPKIWSSAAGRNTVDAGYCRASGDARGSSANSLTAEFLGDYNYAVASNTYGSTVWNDVRNATDCPAVDAFRQSLASGSPVSRPSPCQTPPTGFGDTEIFGWTSAP